MLPGPGSGLQSGISVADFALSVLQSPPAKRGWESFTDRVIEVLNSREEPMVFLLWGSYAQKKAAFVDREKHLVLEGPHPSPLSAHRGFFGCRHFSKANDFLISNKQSPINWELPSLDQ